MRRFPLLTSLSFLAVFASCTGEAPVSPARVLDVAAAESRAAVFPSTCCYYQGQVVRTVVPPASAPQQGRDNFYGFPSGAATGQLGVVAVAPGDTNYHGGQWAFHAVTWNVTPYLLTSESAVLAAQTAGDVTVTRVTDNDFKCPIQP
ncbi:MAG: DUF7482 domain-containing protein [Gammaproteobacteria bacterium]